MTILNKFLSKLLGRDNHVRKKHDLKPASDEESIRTSPHISLRAVDGVAAQALDARFYAPELPVGVIPAGFAKSSLGLALDAANNRCYDYANSFYAEMNSFIGYGTLSEMATRSEYRAPTTTLAVEMTRKWIKIKTTGQTDRTKVTAIEQALIKHRVQDLMRKAAEQDGFFGRAQIFIDIKGQENKQDLPLLIDPASIQKGSLKGFKNVEAIWTSPVEYNAIDPTDKWFFHPRSWFVMGKQVHSDRLLTLISHPLPDVLKPAFNFGGISMSQLLMPYVERFLRTSESISDLVHSFSITGIKTDLQATLAGGNGDDLIRRAELFNKTRDNRGLMILNHDTEEFFQHNTPLSGLDKLQAQAQEQMAAPCHIPLIKLLGITPSGLNSSSDSEIRVFYDYVHAMQEALFTDPLEIILKVIQLDLFGEIDSNITFDYEPLYELDGEALARVRKSDADTAQVLIHGGVISAGEERLRLVGDPNSGYQGLDGALPIAEDFLPVVIAGAEIAAEGLFGLSAEELLAAGLRWVTINGRRMLIRIAGATGIGVAGKKATEHESFGHGAANGEKPKDSQHPAPQAGGASGGQQGEPDPDQTNGSKRAATIATGVVIGKKLQSNKSSPPATQEEKAQATTTPKDSVQPPPTVGVRRAAIHSEIRYESKKNTGSVKIRLGAEPDENELRAGKGLADVGYQVEYLPTASSLGIQKVRTADLAIHSVGMVDVYTPKKLTETDSIIRMIEKKRDQANGVIVQADLTTDKILEIANRVFGKPTTRRINVVFFQDSSGNISRFNRK